MFLRSSHSKKDGKDHRYFSIVENRRVGSDQTVQRTVLYLGEINDQQQAAWRKSLEVFDESQQRYTTLSLFPEVWIPTQNGRWLVLPRYTQPEKEVQILLDRMKRTLPSQPPPRLTMAPGLVSLPLPTANQPHLW